MSLRYYTNFLVNLKDNIAGNKNDYLISNKICYNVTMTLDGSLYYPDEKTFNASVLQTLLFLKPINNIKDIIDTAIDEDVKTKLMESYKDIGINDADLNTYIETYMLKGSEEKIPVEMLKVLKQNLVNQNVLGLIGASTGKILRDISFPNANVLSPLMPQELQAKDTLKLFRGQYEKLVSNEANPDEAKEKFSFDVIYPKLAITHIDQIQNLINYLKSIVIASEANKEAASDYELGLIAGFTLYFNLPQFTSSIHADVKTNIWSNKKVIDEGLLTMTFNVINGKLRCFVNQNVANLDYFSSYYFDITLFCKIIARASGLELGRIEISFNKLILGGINTPNTPFKEFVEDAFNKFQESENGGALMLIQTLIENMHKCVLVPYIKDFSDFSDLDNSYFYLEEPENG